MVPALGRRVKANEVSLVVGSNPTLANGRSRMLGGSTWQRTLANPCRVGLLWVTGELAVVAHPLLSASVTRLMGGLGTKLTTRQTWRSVPFWHVVPSLPPFTIQTVTSAGVRTTARHQVAGYQQRPATVLYRRRSS